MDNIGARKGDSILRLPDVEKRTGLRRATIYRRAGEGTFPKPVRLGPNSTGWLESEIDGFLAGLAAARDAQAGVA
ncbi:MAG: AlpA family transcriptional regulator [Xanthomonadaceae bacterium]|nr:AlpA family transcriptional regulator [Xanthomonadaceae bacterium]